MNVVSPSGFTKQKTMLSLDSLDTEMLSPASAMTWTRNSSLAGILVECPKSGTEAITTTDSSTPISNAIETATVIAVLLAANVRSIAVEAEAYDTATATPIDGRSPTNLLHTSLGPA